MKIKKILSSALVVVMIFGALFASFPMASSAAYDSDEVSSSLNTAEIKAMLEQTLTYQFESAQKMLDYEMSKGYLVASSTDDGMFTMYVNRYSGAFYYRNNFTGQLLTSNPYDVGYIDSATGSSAVSKAERENLSSQIFLEFTETASGKKTEYNSYVWAANYAQIATEFISGGIRVSYTLGDTSTRFLLPGRMTAERFESVVLIPALSEFEDLLEQHCSNYSNENFSFLENDKYKAYTDGCINSSELKSYLKAMNSVYTKIYNSKKMSYASYSELSSLQSDITMFIATFALKNPAKYEEGTPGYNNLIKDYYTSTTGKELEIYETLEPMYVFTGTSTTDWRVTSMTFQKRTTGYSYTDMYSDEEYCGFVYEAAQKPVFRCSLEYTFNSDGTLSVRLPANSITFDETVYTLNSIIPLKFFGAGNMENAGYLFYPDGSGTIVDFEDFYQDKNRLYLTSTVYGNDYTYSKITGQHREQISMPVYGIVNEVAASERTAAITGKDTATNGYFAILEEGASLANMAFQSGGAQYKYTSIFCSYTPYPTDTYDVSDIISVGGNKEYTIVANSKYNGSYVTRIVMLSDETVGDLAYGRGNYYPASYVGMASYYRNYLVQNGTLKAIENADDKLPLYIEALGSMKILAKVLSFPVSKKLELTTFDNVLTMYNELKADGLDNVNFRLTGFGNGGLYYTYPTKVRWDSACGGADAFEELVKQAEIISQQGGNLGIYPDYDFMYIKYTAAFDGISTAGNVSKMVDNRYASKQIYNSVLNEWESFLTLVINPAALSELYAKFEKQYSKYDISSVSVATMGSDLNSNFDEDEHVSRDDAKNYVVGILESMKSAQGLDIMTDVGNSYSLKYVSHILNAAIDSSHFSYSSYAIPFVGMVLHGFINYTGTPLNYAGSPDYDLLRSIESGASLYYILCYQNSAYLKEDVELNQYYGVDYTTWRQSIVETYNKLNAAIGNLQTYNIVDHKIIIGERVIEESEQLANYATLKAEMLEMLDKQIASAVANGYRELSDMKAEGLIGYGVELKLSVSNSDVKAQFAEILGFEVSELDEAFVSAIDAIIKRYTDEYASDASDAYVVSMNAVEYSSKYSFITNSVATDKENYVYTDFTSDIGNIAMVTYSDGTNTVKFILNYNIYTVKVNLGDGNVYEIGKNDYVKIG